MKGIVSEKDLVGAMRWIRELRKWALVNDTDPWAVRQAILMALEMDTEAALQRGVKLQALQRFDEIVKADIKEWLKEQGRRP